MRLTGHWFHGCSEAACAARPDVVLSNTPYQWLFPSDKRYCRLNPPGPSLDGRKPPCSRVSFLRGCAEPHKRLHREEGSYSGGNSQEAARRPALPTTYPLQARRSLKLPEALGPHTRKTRARPTAHTALRRLLRGPRPVPGGSPRPAMAGFFTAEGLRPAPPGLPTLRAFQLAQGEVAQRWLSYRTGWR